MATQEVTLKQIEPLFIAGIRKIVPTAQDIGKLFDELSTLVKNTEPAGPPFAIFYHFENVQHDIDIEAAIPINPSQPVDAGLTARPLDGVETAACIIHEGPYESIEGTYNILMPWITANGYRMDGPGREVYVRGPGPDVAPSTYITEIQIPVAKV